MSAELPTDANATDFDYLAASLEAEMQMNVAAGYFSRDAFQFYIGQMRQLCQRALGESADQEEGNHD